MNIAEQIRTHRKALGLTQEAVAHALGVTAPAVNKWERNVSLPDVALLPALARLLGMDMNTLFSFHESLSEHEVSQIANRLYEEALSGHLECALASAQESIQAYPRDIPLIYLCAVMLSAALPLATSTEAIRAEAEDAIAEWFQRVAESDDGTIRAAARYQLAAFELNRGHFEDAEALIQTLPDAAFDKNTLNLRLLAAQARYDDAALACEAQVLQMLVALHTHLMQLIEYESKSGHDDRAAALAEQASALIRLFGLWDYEAATPFLVLALYRKDRDQALEGIARVLSALEGPWDASDHTPFWRLAQVGKLPDQIPPIRAAFLREMRTQPEYDFLREEPAFQAFFAKD